MEVLERSFHGFTGLSVKWKEYELTVIPAIGGRVLGYSIHGKQILYSMPELYGQSPNLAPALHMPIKEFRENLGIQLYGGFKTWLSPQSSWGDSPFVDLDLAPYQADIKSDNTYAVISLQSPVCRETGMSFFRTISVSDQSSEVKIELGMTNHNPHRVRYGLWDVTQICSPGSAIFPFKDPVKDFELSRSYARIEALNDDTARVECDPSLGMFKIGTSRSEGWLLSTHEDIGFLKRFPVFRGEECGHGCAVEVYNAQQFPYYEVEVHTPVFALEKEQSYTYTQIWNLFNVKNNDIRSIIDIMNSGSYLFS